MTITAPPRTALFDGREILHLRRWGQEQRYPLPRDRDQAITIGSAADCDIQIDHPYVSRQHAQLCHDGQRWQLRDQSKNGMYIDGVRHTDICLDAGMEIDFGGGAVLVAEDPKRVELRRYLARLIGWSEQKRVDAAIRQLRLATVRGGILIVQGQEDMVPIARRLHGYLQPTSAPFILCDPRRRAGSDSLVRSPWNIGDVQLALAAALGGTLCLRHERLPEGSTDLLLRADEERGEQRVQIVICADSRREAFSVNTPAIEIPPLGTRSDPHLRQIIAEYAEDARTSLRTGCQLSAEDLSWVRKHASSSFDEIEKGTLRLLTVRCVGTILGAAQRLGITAVSLRRWMNRRSQPIDLCSSASDDPAAQIEEEEDEE